MILPLLTRLPYLSRSRLQKIFCFISVLLLGVAANAVEVCGSKHSRPDLGLTIKDPVHSHRIFSENRWQCVSAVNKEIKHSAFSSFGDALTKCASLTQDNMVPQKDSIIWRSYPDAQKDLYCFNLDSVTAFDLYIGHAVINLTPWGYGESNIDIPGASSHTAALLQWKKIDSYFWARLEYTADFKTSRCNDPVCDANATTGSQFTIPLIEPAYGTVDLSIPLMSAEFPGLLPLSLHYSSWNTVKKSYDYTASGIDIGKGAPPYPSREDDELPNTWYKSWHHSYEKKLLKDLVGSTALGYQLSGGRGNISQLYLHLPSEDVLVFAKEGDDWKCVSHPGVRSRIREFENKKFELYRPDGYREVYDEVTGNLNQVFYPDGRKITITRVGVPEGLEETIQQNYPPASVMVFRDWSSNIKEIYSIAKPSYRYKFHYTDNPRNVYAPQLTGITRPDNALISVDQTALGYHLDNVSYLLNSISVGGKTLLSLDYDEKGRAKSVTNLSGNNFSVSYTSTDAATLISSSGVDVVTRSSKKLISDTEFLGQVNAPLLAGVTCDDCGFYDSYSYSTKGTLSSINRSGDEPFVANFSTAGLLSDVHYGESEFRSFNWNPDLNQLSGISGSDVLATSIVYKDARVTQMTSVAGTSQRKVDIGRVNGDAKKLSGYGKDMLSVDYTAQGFISATGNRMGQSYQFKEHNHLGQPTKVIDPNNIETQLRYDVLGQLTDIIRGDGVFLNVKYNLLGLPTSASVDGNSMTFKYDGRERLKSLSSSCKPSIEYSYDANGYVSSVTHKHGDQTQTTRYEFDADGTPIKQINEFGDKSSVAIFNKQGQVTEVKDDENTTNYSYNGNGYVNGISLNGSVTSSYAIGAMGRLDSATSGGGRKTSITYTELGKVQGQRNENFDGRNYTYTSGYLSRRATSLYDYRYIYDLNDRIDAIAHVQLDGLSPTIKVDYGYDDVSVDEAGKNYGVGRLTSVDNKFSHYDYRYSINGDLNAQKIIFPGTGLRDAKIGYATNSNGLLTDLTYPDGSALTYERNNCSGQVTGLLWKGSRLAILSSKSQLTPFTGADLGNGIVISRKFDARKRLKSIGLEKAGVALWEQGYEYDGRQNVKTVTTIKPIINVGTNQEFKYDLQNRLTEAAGNYGKLIYDYNTHSHRTAETNGSLITSYRYHTKKDQIKSLVDASGVSFKDYLYDNDGKRIQAGPWKYTYDAAGRLASVAKDGVWVATYQYDTYGKRISKKTDAGTTYFYHDAGGRLLQESNESGSVIRQYIYTDMGELFAVVNTSGAIAFIHSDNTGTPLFLTSSTGEVVWSAERKPFGETEITKNVIEFPIRLPGQYYDAETGLHYNQQRYYDPETGQYLSTDPLSVAGGHQLYNYAKQNPTSYVDPEGQIAFLAAIPYIITGVSVGATGYEVYDTVDGLASGRVTKEDLAAGYLQDKAIAIGLKALPGVGATAGLVYGYLNRSPVGVVATNSANSLSGSEAAANIREARNILKEAGIPLRSRNEIIQSFDLETFRIETVASTRTEFRVFDDFSSRLDGRYVSPDFFNSQTDRITNFALPSNSATRFGQVTIPEGSIVFTGKVAPQTRFSPGLTGGANQTFLTGPLSNYNFLEVPKP